MRIGMDDRVYIGGFDPDRLPASEIIDRIRSTLDDQVEIVSDLSNIDKDQTYLHINLRPKREGSPLEAVVKLLNNVKWKGCKLTVEKAKPYFLERLQEEIRTRSMENEMEETEEGKQKEEVVSTLPRHLRIRERYGREAKKVDTRPMTVEDWTRFRKMKDKLARRKALRSVHIRFEPANDTPMLVEDDSDSSSTSSSSSSSSEEVVQGRYQWSDSSSDESESEAESVQDNHVQQQEKALYNEFAAGIEAADEVSSEEEASSEGSEEDSTGHSSFVEETRNIVQDVEQNLNILAQLFPEMSDVKPSVIEKKSERKEPKSLNRMVRFDPTKAEDEKFVMSEDDNKEGDKSSEKDDSSEEDHEDESMAEPTNDDEETETQVYEQGKLEKVFRSAREEAPVKEAAESGAFSFGFRVDEAKDAPAGNSSTFAFNFGAADKSNTTNETSGAPSEPLQVNMQTSEAAPKTRSIFFEESEVLKYMEDFYKMNDGERIMNNPEEWRADEKVKEAWNKKRKILTDDWKQKKKNAASRRKRKF